LQYLKKFNKDHSLKIIFLAGALLGGIIFLLLFGVHILDVTYVDRILVRQGVEDLPQHYLAWECFRHSAWSFPLGNIDNLIYPENISIVYSDSIPLFAVIFKLFSPILPSSFQYFGIWTLLCFMLQGAFASLISYHFSKSKVISLIYSVFFVLSTILLKRTFYHSALSAHWLILAAFAIWLFKNEFKSKKHIIILFAILNALTVTIEAYFTPLVIGIMLCFLFQDVIDTKKWKLTIITIASSFVAILATTWIFGYFSSNISPSTVGLGMYSFNLKGFINTAGDSSIFSEIKLYLPGQLDGNAYLGFGIFVLLGFSFIHLIVSFFKHCLKKGLVALNVKHYIPWITLLVVFIMLALSPQITYGEKLLISINWPTSVINILSIFRSSGRFIWPVFYVIFIFCIREVSLFQKNIIANMNKKKGINYISSILIVVMMLMLLVAQLYDISPLLNKKNKIISKEVVYASPFQSDVWDELAKTHKYLYISSPIYELYWDYGVQSISLNLEKFAVDHNMILNAAYLSRDISKEKDIEITEHFSNMAQGAVYDDYIYIFPNLKDVPGSGYGLHYYSISGFTVGVNTAINGLDEIYFN